MTEFMLENSSEMKKSDKKDFDLEKFRKESERIKQRYPKGNERSALIPMLHLVQSYEGYVSDTGIKACADVLDISESEVSAVATFYSQFKRYPNGQYTIGICTNALCGVMGGDEIFECVSKTLEIGHDETTADGKITLEALECNAACDYAPVIMVNWEFFDNQTPQTAMKLIEDIRNGKEIHPTRGPEKVYTFKEISRTLAGFEDGHVDEGLSAGKSSLLGKNIHESVLKNTKLKEGEK